MLIVKKNRNLTKEEMGTFGIGAIGNVRDTYDWVLKQRIISVFGFIDSDEWHGWRGTTYIVGPNESSSITLPEYMFEKLNVEKYLEETEF